MYVEPDSAHKDSVREIKQKLNLDEDFHAVRNLVEILLPLLECGHTSERQQAWLKALNEIKTNGIARGWGRLPPSGRGGNPLGGQFSKYPIPSMLLQPLDPRISKQAQGLIQLFLCSMLCNYEKNHAETAQELRKAFTKNLTLVEQLPFYTDFENYAEELSGRLIDAQHKQHDKPTTELLNLAKNLLSSAYKPSDEPTTVQPTPPYINKPIAFIGTGLITTCPTEHGYVTPFKVGPAIDDGTEGPTSVQIFIGTEVIDVDGLLPTEEEVDTQASLSKFWIRRQQSLIPTDSGRLTPIEKRHFIAFIQAGICSNDAAERVSAGLLGTMYVTGQSLEQVLGCSTGSMQTFSSDGLYRIDLKQPIDAYKPKPKALLSLVPATADIALLLPEPVHSWIKSFCDDSKTQTLSESLCLTVAEAKDHLQKALEKLRSNGLFQRLRIERIPAALAIELTLAHRDMVTTFLLSSTDNHAPPMLSYYLAHKVEYLEKCYESVTQEMLQSTAVTLPVKNLGISKSYPTDDAIKLLIEGLSSNLNAAKKQKNIAVTHNAYTDFCLALLFCATGHRAIIDPFESKKLFDLETGTLLISDKVTDASRAWRLVALSEIGVAQITAYDVYLTKLAAWLSDVPDNQELVAKIVGLTRGYEPIPYFFYLDENQSGRIRSITVAELNKRWSEYWLMPIGMLRHVAATELQRESGRTDWVEIQLGHSNSLNHVFGKHSTLSVLETLKKIGESTGQYMHRLGWEHKKSPLKMPNISLIGIVIKEKKNLKIGSKKRAKVREEAEQRRSALVRKIIGQELQQPQTLPTPVQFTKIIEALITAAAQEQISANSYLKLFYRYIGMQRGGKDLLRKIPQVRQLEQETSPFNERSQTDYQELLRTRSMFLAMLEEKGRSGNSFELEERVAEIIFSAALFGGFANTERLERLQTALIKSTFQLQGQLFIDIPLLDSEPAPIFRWFPDALSNLLIVGLYRSRLTVRKISLETLNNHIKKIADKLNLNTKNILTTLAALSSTALLFEVPGYIRSYMIGEIAAVSISLPAFVRVITDRALVTDSAAKQQMNTEEGWSPAIRLQTKVPTANEERKFIKLLRKIFTDSQPVEVSGNKSLSRKIKDSLVKNLKKEFGSSTNLTSLHAAIVSWAVYLCQSGTRFTASLKYRTIENYVFLITNSLVTSITQDDFLSLDESGFEQIYLRTIESADTHRRLNVASRLKEFHDFLINNYETDDIEWSAIFAAAGVFVEPTFSNANFISENEYYDILFTINSDTSLSKQLSTQYAMLVLLGYRFGLRFGEALRLQYRDVQYNQEDFYLWIHNSIFGETKSAAGVRIIMLFEDLSDIEKTIIQSSLDYAAESFLEDSQAAVVTQNIESRGLIDRYSATNYISKKIKMVTGDNSIRFHHLRHSWATKTFTLLNKDIYPPQCNQFTPKNYNNKQLEKFLGESEEKYPLRSIMTAIGHNRESTTIASYIHTIDQISVATIDKVSVRDFNNFIQSYALKRSSADIRKRKSRDLKNNIDVSIPFPNIETKPRELNYENTTFPSPVRLSLNKIDLLLRRFSKTQQDISKIANRLFINSDQAKKIIEIAASTERDSGFTCYKLYRKSNDPIVKSGELKQGSDLLKAENIRIQKVLENLDSDLNKLSIGEISIIENCLKVWIKTNEKSGINIVSDYSELKSLIHGLSILDLDLKMSIMIKNNTSNHLISDLNKLNIPIQVVNQLPASTEKTAVRRTGRVGLKIESNKSVGPRRTLLRVLTVINIWISC